MSAHERIKVSTVKVQADTEKLLIFAYAQRAILILRLLVPLFVLGMFKSKNLLLPTSLSSRKTIELRND